MTYYPNYRIEIKQSPTGEVGYLAVIDNYGVDISGYGPNEIEALRLAYKNWSLLHGETTKLNIGCGYAKIKGYIGIDKVAHVEPDLRMDITKDYLPFPDNCVEHILCDNVLEHIGPPEAFIFVLNEIWRVLKPGKKATIIVPDGRSQAAWQDPTHVRAFVPRSALYWNQDLQWAKLYGIKADFNVSVREFGDMDAEAFIVFDCEKR